MKLRSYGPALVALAALVALYVFVVRGGDDATSPAPPEAPRDVASPAPTRVDTPGAAARSAATPPAPAPSGERPTGPPRALTPEEYAGHEAKAKKPKMTLEEKLAETRTHIAVMERRAELLEKEIADLERSGDREKAAAQRIVLERLHAHRERLRKAVEEGREPE